jgi:hypothetical protein
MTMMNDFQLDKGSIWEIYYMEEKRDEVDHNLLDQIVDSNTRGILQDTFNPPPGLTPAEYSLLFTQHFMKTREKSREIIENDKNLVRVRVLSQVGNIECLDELQKIEASLDFQRWENPSIVEFFREISKSQL